MEQFKTLNECIEYVCESLGGHASAYNVESIVRKAFEFDEARQAFVLKIDEIGYWDLVMSCEKWEAAK